ncbi:MAG: cytochrome c, partial [Gammaproteobacteria bacterium]|nr:cytochrome c [Gammaproteobacteria bacterium]
MRTRSTAYLLGILSPLLISCTNEAPPDDSSKHIGATFEAQELDAPESMERLAEARRIQEAHPGRAIYQRTCAHCHEQGVAKAPHTGMIGMMTP